MKGWASVCGLVIALLFLNGRGTMAQEQWRADFDGKGGMWGIVHDEAFLPLGGIYQIATPQWKPYAGTDDAREVAYAASGQVRRWSAKVPLGDERSFRCDETVRETPDHVELRLKVRAEQEVTLDGIYYRLNVPLSFFAGGVCRLGTQDEPAPLAENGEDKVCAGTARSIHFADEDGNWAIDVEFDRECRISVNRRSWGLQPHYDALVQFHHGAIGRGQSAELGVRIAVKGRSDRAPATVRLLPSEEMYELDGFGGNYCYWPDGPDVEYTLEQLKPRWARTQMALDFWEEENDNSDPNAVDWSAFQDVERGQWILKGEMEAAREIKQRGIPLIISVWRVPEWMREEEGGINPAASAELAESVTAYLIYVRDKYGVEPELFSFNEPDLRNIRDPQHYRGIIRSIGERLEREGLKTRILAADTANPRGDKLDYAKPALEDPQTRRFMRGLSFHSWGGATAERYGEWSALARKHDLPLFVAEIGPNALAHRRHASGTQSYALQELRMYQELLLHARPQVLLEWEYGGSYPLLLEKGGALEPTYRYWLMKHYATLTPQPGVAIGSESDHPDVLLTAFRNEGGTEWAAHVANLGASRVVRVVGVPAQVREVSLVTSNPGMGFESLGSAAVSGGALELSLPSRSLTTLTW